MESLERKIDLLRSLTPFATLPTEHLRPVAQAADVVRIAAEEVIVRQGGPGDAVFGLIDGTAEVWLEERAQQPVLLRSMRSGQLFGETAVLYRGRRSATIKAKTDILAIRIPAAEFLALLQSSPDLALRIAVILAQRLASDRHTLVSDPTASDGA
jgi:CRP-like cAMP-binding protein